MGDAALRPSLAEARVRPSFDEVYEMHFDYVYRIVSRLAGGREVDDMVQEVFLVVHRRLDEFEGRAQLTTWLFRIAYRVVGAYIRRERLKRLVLGAAGREPSLWSSTPPLRIEHSDLQQLGMTAPESSTDSAPVPPVRDPPLGDQEKELSSEAVKQSVVDSRSAARRIALPAPTPELSAYKRARQLENEGKLVEALAAYEQLTKGNDPVHRQEVLYAIARLLLQQGKEDAALAAFVRYRADYPDGRYAEACATHQLLLLTRAGRQQQARNLAREFLEKWPNDPRAWRFRLVRAAARIEQGDCRGGLEDLTGMSNNAEAERLRRRCEPSPK